MIWSDGSGYADLAVGGNGSDVLRGGGGSDVLLGRDGADTLEGGEGTDLLIGGAGFDQYIVGRGIDVVSDDFYGDGAIRTEGGVALSGGHAAGKRNTWVGANGETYTFTPSQGSTLGTLRIGNLGSGNAVRIDNFDLTRAMTTSYLGVRLDSRVRVVVGEAGGANPFAVYSGDTAAITGHTSIAEGTGRAYTVHLNVAARAGDRITLALSGLANAFQAVLGDTTVPADGAVITLVEGQTEVSFGLLQAGDFGADQEGSLRVSYSGANGTAESNAWDIDVSDDGSAAAQLDGDQTYATYVATADISRDGRIVVNRGDIAFLLGTDGNLVPGGDVSITDNILYGTDRNDRINGLAGNDALDGGAGNDWLDGGVGDDLIAGGAGHNTLAGGAGNDFILGAGGLHAGLQQLGPNDRWQAPAGKLVYGSGSTWGVYRESDLLTIWDGAADSGAGAEASAIDAGDGDDQVIAGPGDDRVDGGAGNDWLDGTAGADFILGGEGGDRIQADGILKAGYLNTTAPGAHGSDFVDGGGGDDDVQGGGAGDVLLGGSGNDRIWGDSRRQNRRRQFRAVRIPRRRLSRR